MKKFKFLSKLLAVLVIVPAILLCTACGGGQLAQEAKVDTKGDWANAATVTTAQFEEYQATVTGDKAAIAKGFHMTQKASAMGMKMYGNGYFVAGETPEKNQLALKYEAEMPAEGDEAAFKMAYEMYLKENHLYIANMDFVTFLAEMYPALAEREDLVYNMDIDLGADYGELSFAYMTSMFTDMMESLEDQNSYTAVLDMFGSFADGNDIIIKKIENGATVKYQITIDAEKIETEYGEAAVEKAELYLIFKDGAFNGAAYNLTGKVTIGETTETIVNEFAITMFEGDVDFPDFSKYMGFADVVGDLTKKMLEPAA